MKRITEKFNLKANELKIIVAEISRMRGVITFDEAKRIVHNFRLGVFDEVAKELDNMDQTNDLDDTF